MAPNLNKIEESSEPAELGETQDSNTLETEQPEASGPRESKSIFSSLREA
jgi:hypothetical protein